MGIRPTSNKGHQRRSAPKRIPIPRAGLEPWSTPNAVVRMHPQTRPVFERLAQGRRFDWSACLDEVAWSHGMEWTDLTAELIEAMHHDATETNGAHEDHADEHASDSDGVHAGRESRAGR